MMAAEAALQSRLGIPGKSPSPRYEDHTRSNILHIQGYLVNVAKTFNVSIAYKSAKRCFYFLDDLKMPNDVD